MPEETDKPIDALKMSPSEFADHLAKQEQDDRNRRAQRKAEISKQRDFQKSAWDMSSEEFKKACDRTRGRESF